ncbi:M57 family metalloprotease [Flavimarina sp. Hel_I_48]|uniref:M57 family metalloprotease n=1 Tax=Flavimarina sp. Hel_I_48 TaxID=1392488 RepID=UPI000690D58C|nr:M57 family metalloprotease [Flavimarina sp. Hel_I_48]
MRKNFTKCLLLLGVGALTLSSCSTDEENITTQESNSIETKVSPEILKQVSEAGMNANYVQWSDFYLPGGEVQKKLLIENDIVITQEQLESMAIQHKKSKGDNDSKQYRTSNIVSQGRNISIIGYTGGTQALSSKERTALQWAVDNYNALNGVSISFTLSFGTNYQNKDMVVYNNSVNNPDGAGGSAGFPSNGNPYKFVQIYNIGGYNTNVIEHVITHEIGHSVGFRHTDFFSRQSCGDNVNEGGDAILVNGTPSGYDATSVMLACFSSSEDGEFGNNDIIALNAMY